MLLYVKNIHSLSFTFSGNLAHTRPRQVMMEYPTFVSSLAAMAESEDPVAQAIALETVGYIGVSLEGKVRTLMKWARTFPHLAIAEP